jgi:hypothetical protein
MTADDDLRLIRMIRTLLTQLEVERAAFETVIAMRPPKARRMSDEIRDALRTRTPMSPASSIERDVTGDVAARSVQAVQMVLENKPDALPLAKALWQAKDDLMRWEDQVYRLKEGLTVWRPRNDGPPRHAPRRHPPSVSRVISRSSARTHPNTGSPRSDCRRRRALPRCGRGSLMVYAGAAIAAQRTRG